MVLTQEDKSSAADPDAETKTGAAEISVPPEIQQAIDQFPPKVREEITSVIMQGSMPHPLADRLTPNHITALIDNDDKKASREHSLSVWGRVYTLFYAVFGIATFFALYVVIGKDNLDLFNQILVYLGTFGAGFAAGWGYSAFKR